MKLYFSRNPNPRLAVAVARYLQAPVTYEFAAPLAPGEAARFAPLNPNLRLPILDEQGRGLWEADAIACRLSRVVSSGFWPSGDDEPEMIRWLSWGKANFVHACDMVQFERGTRRRYDLGPTDERQVEEGLAAFRRAAALLEPVLAGRDWLVGDAPTYADFRMATFLPFNDVARLPLSEFAAVSRWYERLEAIPAWRDPFQGLSAPELPPVTG
ncbi:glutathione S-transferase family protein [Nitratireductor mangrovi]|uniref:Glutathione S-transferase family protein n=1 Tax=Nitratireductor mangrovi TaxID=2599600 RepID=A0A5B8L269_9HYPH|nr:glutathione S-transferase family protein [Nitratireductor mangrovi]QDZ02104.1 glutathione S-transferase family protein [Nitratireductor mangrovi]